MLDADNLPDQQPLSAQLCIVGGGAAGVAVALGLVGSGIRVLLLEAGNNHTPAAGSAPQADGATTGGIRGIRRGVRCQRLSANEFSERPHIPDSGWPVTAEAMAPYYARALELCESPASGFSARHDEITLSAPLLSGLQAEPFAANTLDRYAAPETLAQRYQKRLAAARNLCRIGHARVVAIGLDASGRRVERLTVRTPGQRTLHVRADIVVLAAGALESVRLLLGSRDQQSAGIGNGYGNVGRYCMSPLRGSIGTVRLHQAPVAIWHGPRNRQRSRRPLVLSAETQQRLRLPAFVMRLRPITDDDFIAAALARLGNRQRPARGSGYGHGFRVNWNAEHFPASDCRMLPGEARDDSGLPTISLDWRTGEAEIDGIRRVLGLFDEVLRTSSAGRFDHDSGGLATLMNTGDQPAGPIVGGLRMGESPRNSVADADGRVHGIDNLYVTGAAVFPTSGLDNPLLTVAALGLRLAEHLKALEPGRTSVVSSPKPARGGGSR